MKGRAGTITERKEIVLTHDIDIFPAYGLQTARLEHKHGVRATYYVLLHSEWYNALSPENMAIWKEIKELGHEIALHYDGNYDMELGIVHSAFCKLLGTSSIHISQHLVGITPDMSIPSSLEDRAQWIKQNNYKYIADSGGWWRKGCICQHLHEKRLIFVCHSIWWVKGQNPFSFAAEDAKLGIDRAKQFWIDMVTEHRKQKEQTVYPYVKV